ncbi:AAA+ family ATPase [Owenweeksia hongkongensis DSM 17368]|uniref:AAA+ family ATPase n=1 Tax=Owenweeksia hongkongensis (strain DSM 17368 / CIP 108786 / JCM 12287 / NRRL B-23963 / UST20020801) TaxID=926562 RepID=G8R6X7_OWEHD|nr:ATP-binding protein [Owenweeksia hongkongensis]AEV32312.1 AAA+ family ATPase [Owenweeksia hongkongensis DSM 17368]
MEVDISRAAKFLQQEINWLEQVVDTRLSLYFNDEAKGKDVQKHKLPACKGNSPYENLVKEYKLSFDERLVLILSLARHIRPQSLDIFLIKNKTIDSDYVEFGGGKDTNEKGFLPTLETACFILNGSDILGRLKFLEHFDQTHIFFKKGILNVDHEQALDLQQKLSITQEYLGLLCQGKKYLPHFSSKFPAKEISTPLDWEDLIVNESVEESLEELKDWLLHSDTILRKWKLDNHFKPGYRALFYGAPGTGKTLAATLLGKATSRPVFRVDLSLVVSKYIGETEKNLSRLFDEAENKDWILFFDEADALFGKRTATKDSHDRYANQEVSYLLQRIEDFPGLVILATNMHSNVDEAFARRFQSMIHFSKPDKKERLRLWEGLLSSSFKLEPKVNLEQVAEDFTLTGGEMVNAFRYCALQAAKRGERIIEYQDLIQGIRREYSKSNKTL